MRNPVPHRETDGSAGHTTSSVQVVERAIAILKAFTASEPELSVTELSQRLQLPKSTVSRILQTLAQAEFVSRNQETGRYRLDVGILALAENVLGMADLRQIARPYLRALANTIGETASLSVLEPYGVVNLELAVGEQRLVMRVGWVGRRMPAHAVSAGKALLAFLPPQEQETFLELPLQAITPKTITDLEQLRAELAEVRRKGYALALEELEEGLHAISAPVWDRTGRPVAAVSVSGPSYRLTLERMRQIAPRVIATATQISRALGFEQDLERLPKQDKDSPPTNASSSRSGKKGR